MKQLSRNLISSSLVFTISLLLLPKIILIEFFSNRWIDTNIGNIFSFLLQDIILVLVVYAATNIFLTKKYSFIYLSILSGILLLALLVDMRVRELWLIPIDLPIIKYSLSNSSDLISGAEIFFNYSSGFGFTFRFIIFICFILYLVACLLFGLSLYKMRRNQQLESQHKSNTFNSIYLIILFLLIIKSITADNAPYNLNTNIFINPPISVLQNLFMNNDQQDKSALTFEQPYQSLSKVGDVPKLHTSPSPSPIFDNLVIVVLESIRWNSLFGLNAVGDTPVLEKLSHEGMLFKSYVSVPHSSKGYYSILSGLHAYPDVEIREAMLPFQENLIHELKIKKNMEAVAFSSLNFQFENMGGFLKSIGISQLHSASEIMPPDARQKIVSSSFGVSDDYLFSSSISYLTKIRDKKKGFIALYFPTAAHYPYNCSDQMTAKKNIEKYEDCIIKMDELLGEMLVHFDDARILDSTLFVFVGDHGESFGEHGLFVHNSSMYEEEVAVPLIFWATKEKLSIRNSIVSQQIDIVPTIADLFGVLDSDLKIQGKSLLRNQGQRAFFMSTFFKGLSSAVVEPPYKYIYDHGAKIVTKFNLEIDPQEKTPISISNEEASRIKNRLLSYSAYQKALFSDKMQ